MWARVCSHSSMFPQFNDKIKNFICLPSIFIDEKHHIMCIRGWPYLCFISFICTFHIFIKFIMIDFPVRFKSSVFIVKLQNILNNHSAQNVHYIICICKIISIYIDIYNFFSFFNINIGICPKNPVLAERKEQRHFIN